MNLSTILCPKCEEIDFQFVDELPQSQQQKLQSVWFGRAYYWKRDDAQHYYYYILHDTFTGSTPSVEQGCHLYSVIYAAFTSRSQSWETKALDVFAAANQITPVVLRSWSFISKGCLSPRMFLLVLLSLKISAQRTMI